MRLISGLLFVVVLAFTPASPRADVLLTNPDEVPAYVHSAAAAAVPDTDVRDRESITILAKSSEAEEQNPSVTVPAEKEDILDEYEKESPQISDPLAPLNRMMFQFNDKTYFWVLKPVAQGYYFILPELVRTGFSNAYDNLKSPARIVNNVLQLRFKRSGNELIRFVFNSVIGVGGFGDVSKGLLGIEKQEADFGQTLGRYGVGHGLYLVLPLVGPTSARDGVGLAGDTFLYPMTYISYVYLNIWEGAGLFTHEKVNDTSFRIGDYEAFKQAAIDPYISMRDAFVQHRQKKVDESRQ